MIGLKNFKKCLKSIFDENYFETFVVAKIILSCNGSWNKLTKMSVFISFVVDIAVCLGEIHEELVD
jgi:hypothetical protein